MRCESTSGLDPVSWAVGYDSRDRVISFNRSTSALSSSSAAYSYDANSNRVNALVQQISDTDLNNSFTTADTNASNSQTSSIASNSNRLMGFSQTLNKVRGSTVLSNATTTVTYSRDSAGNLTSDGLRVFEYDAQNRHSKTVVNDPDEGSKITYLHNALGQRVFKSEPKVDHVAPNATALGMPFVDWLMINFGWMFAQAQLDATLGQAYVYDDGQLGSTPVLLGEYGNGASNSLGRFEYIYLPTESGQAIPIGQHRTTIISATHTDHLGTPRKITGTDNNTAWQMPYSAFGENAPTGILTATSNAELAFTTDTATATKLATSNPLLTYNLRFPGQYFDQESNLSYNYFRSYQPTQGRYTQSDPIGLGGGINPYQYAESNPLSYTDPLGLWVWGDPLPEEVVNVCAGFGDGVSLGVTSLIRQGMGTNGAVDMSSPEYLGGLVAGAVVTAKGYSVGAELSIGRNFRMAPWGNRTGHPIGRYPHYHRRGAPDAKGNTPPGQGIGRHRPWENKSTDKCGCDRF